MQKRHHLLRLRKRGAGRERHLFCSLVVSVRQFPHRLGSLLNKRIRATSSDNAGSLDLFTVFKRGTSMKLLLETSEIKFLGISLRKNKL